MPQNVKLDINGVDNTFFKLPNGNDNVTVYKTPIKSLPYRGSANLNLNPDTVSMYDLNTHKISGRPDIGDLTDMFKTSIPSSSYGSAAGKIKRITTNSSSILDPFSNTVIETLGPSIAQNISLPYRDEQTSKVSSNTQPLTVESINRSAVDFYNNYSTLNYQPHGTLENRSQTSAAANRTLVRRLSEAKNTYFNSNSPKNIRYNAGVIEPTYEQKSKLNNNQFYINTSPKTFYTIKNFEKRYEKDLKLL